MHQVGESAFYLGTIGSGGAVRRIGLCSPVDKLRAEPTLLHGNEEIREARNFGGHLG